MAKQGIVHGPLGGGCLHLCVDMQRLFAPGAPWAVPWAEPVLPKIERVVEQHPERTLFTRFIPAERPGGGPGTWSRYYKTWSRLTLEQVDLSLIELVPSLARFVPPAKVIDKKVYSPWTEGTLDAMLRGSEIDTLIVTGGETDVCVLASVLGAVDRGFRVVLVTDALCSSSDETHDALMKLYERRFTDQIELTTTEQLIENWR